MKIEFFIGFFGGEKSMPALAKRAGTKKQLINYDFGRKTYEEPAPAVRIHIYMDTHTHIATFDIKTTKREADPPPNHLSTTNNKL